LVTGSTTRWPRPSTAAMSAIAWKLVAVAAAGSRSHSGAPTSAASGMTMSACASSGRMTFIERTSPRTTSKAGLAQTAARLSCAYMKLSITVTAKPRSSSAGTSTDPR
jgi:hypothetical protein